MDRSISWLRPAFLAATLLTPAVLAPVTLYATAGFDSNTFGALRARPIGPAVMGGRVASLDAIPGDPLTLYVGAAGGGLWKSADGGISFTAIFDDHNQSIGAIKVDPSASDTLWVGTGESWTRNSVSVGEGVFKSTDGGDSWNLVGLENSERISEILVHPEDSATVWVCATGQLWSGNEERGVFRTTDGGETWKKALYVDADTGCADLDIDPQDPSILYASMWQFRRSPDFFNSGGPGSGLYKSVDSGESWRRLEQGLPSGELGRIAIAVAPSRPNLVYATIEAEHSALYRSDDLGESWRMVNDSTIVTLRPFYFGLLRVDPSDYRRLYKPGFFLAVSTDSGESFNMQIGGTHPDHHALWIDPGNAKHLLLGTDGGVYESFDHGTGWRHLNQLPISQFYRVSHDLEEPYNVYGGLQDNGTWTAPSRGAGGIFARDWQNIGFGDGFWAFADPQDPRINFVEFQGGQLLRVDRETQETKWIQPFAEGEQERLRFNWNTPIHLSPNDPKTLYYGSQHLHRSRDRGDSWSTISPDLTTDDPAKQRQHESGGLSIDNSTAENHCSIYTISESPKDPKVLWVGTDDGNLQLSRDAGQSWTNVTQEIPDLPPNTWVSFVSASPHDAGTAFVTFDGHRSGDPTPRLYRTTDFGATWHSLIGHDAESQSPEVKGYTHVIKQDPVNPDLLFLGTEFGLYLSLDGGQDWARFKENLPPVSVRDLSIHPTEHDLILATHGRGIYIIDDITPLRALRPEMLDEKLVLLPSRPTKMPLGGGLQLFGGSGEFVGENPPADAAITYYLKKRHLFGDFKIEIFSQDGELITTLPAKKRPGLNRVGWPMRLKPPKLARATNLVPVFGGPRVPEGTYRVKLIKGKQTVEGEVQLVADPRSPHAAADRALQQSKALEIYHALADLTYLTESLDELDQAMTKRREGLAEKGRLARDLDQLSEHLEETLGQLVSRSKAGRLSGDVQLREKLGALFGAVSTYDGRPTDSQLGRTDTLLRQMQQLGETADSYLAEALPALNRQLERKQLQPLERLSRRAWEERDDGSGTSTAGSTAGVLNRQQRRLLAAATKLAWLAF